MPEHWSRFRAKLKQVPLIADIDAIDGDEDVPLIHADMTRRIKFRQILELANKAGALGLPTAAPPVSCGMLCPTFGEVPTGWLLCDGRAVSRTQYARLFAWLGTRFGKGDGLTTFNLPDLRGKLTMGKAPEPVWMIAI